MTAAPSIARYQLSAGSSVTLDLLRAVSAEAVVVGHLISGLQLAPLLRPPHLPPMQNAAVVVFFLLSGFLITYVVVSRRRQEGYGFWSYAIDRFARIYTGFLPAIAIVFVLDSLQIAVGGLDRYPHADALNVRTAVGNILMLQDFPFIGSLGGPSIGQSPLVVTSLGSGRTFWTLAIEWWIYLAFGWAILASSMRLRRPALYWLVLVPISIVPVWNLIAGRGNGLALMWLAGGAVYLVISRHLLKGMRATSAAAAGVALLILALVRLRVTVEAYDAIFAVLLAASLCFWIVAMDAGNVVYPRIAQRCIRIVADYSFTLFLTHLSVYELVTRWIEAARVDAPRWLVFATIFVLANGLAVGVASLTEMRHRKVASWMKMRLLGGRGARQVVQAR